MARRLPRRATNDAMEGRHVTLQVNDVIMWDSAGRGITGTQSESVPSRKRRVDVTARVLESLSTASHFKAAHLTRHRLSFREVHDRRWSG